MKKAQDRPAWMIVLLVLMIVGLAIGAVILYALGSAGFINIEDHFCRFSNQMRGKTTVPIAGELRPGEVAPRVPKFCITQYTEIEANDWGKCDKSFEELSHSNMLGALRKCAAQQVAHLAYRCWWMGLEGTSDPASWMCFTGKVILDKPTIKQNAEAAGDVLRDIREKIKEKLKCVPGYKREEALMSCSKFNNIWEGEGYLKDLIQDRLILSGVIDFYEDKIFYGNAKFKDEEHLGIKDCVKKDVGADELFSELLSKLDTSVLSGKVNTLEDGCENIFIDTEEYIEEIKNRRQIIEKKDKQIVQILRGALGEDADEIIKQITVETDEGEKIIDVHLIDSISEVVFSVVSLPPNLGEIKEKHVEEIIRTTNILGEDELYSSSIRSDDLEFIEGFTITPNALFEIGYCDPPLEIGAGLVSRFTCGDIEKGFPQRVQIASGGRGAGGITRSGSPYCDLGIFPGVPDALRNGCKAILG